jgi:hypothetical protein
MKFAITHVIKGRFLKPIILLSLALTAQLTFAEEVFYYTIKKVRGEIKEKKSQPLGVVYGKESPSVLARKLFELAKDYGENRGIVSSLRSGRPRSNTVEREYVELHLTQFSPTRPYSSLRMYLRDQFETDTLEEYELRFFPDYYQITPLPNGRFRIQFQGPIAALLYGLMADAFEKGVLVKAPLSKSYMLVDTDFECSQNKVCQFTVDRIEDGRRRKSKSKSKSNARVPAAAAVASPSSIAEQKTPGEN